MPSSSGLSNERYSWIVTLNMKTLRL